MALLAPIHTEKMTADQYFMLGEDPPGVLPFPNLDIPLADLWTSGA